MFFELKLKYLIIRFNGKLNCMIVTRMNITKEFIPIREWKIIDFSNRNFNNYFSQYIICLLSQLDS